ncbi:hypothetical protein M409DRAFT_70256 [Zasmidium cellare ATCC 36951]|uniref:PARP catalytic domain-containing protein n=1 Tax=Zasmidium cellare ATCC 36951 TaxID=1080233 RepID=A0A6A6C111_ZASCE|nr:uncharacterized protein M409DRAFT_70256 [Zasmidium cellare ATCC 36951]KAF2160724.1 hypothetical protein M409DRAFT_70256 [Zasmidium cellare ATCC 36951]
MLVISDHQQPQDSSSFQDRAALVADTLNVLLQTHLPSDINWTVSQTRWRFQLTNLSVELSDESSKGIVVTASSDVIPRKRLDPLRQELRAILGRALESSWSTIGFGVLLLQLTEEASCHLLDFRNALESSKKPDPMTNGWDSSAHDVSGILTNPYGVNLNTVDDTARHVLGQSISDILSDIPDDLRVLHVEPVFRPDLVDRFLKRQQKMKEELMDLPKEKLRSCVGRSAIPGRNSANSAERMAEYLVRPHVTFHGAEREVMSPIIRYGFLLPGSKIGDTGESLSMRFVNAWFGKGIYSSPSLDFAADYGEFDYKDSSVSGWRKGADIPGMRVLVCATLMGLLLEVSRDEVEDQAGLDNSHANSHVSPDGMEYVVFDPAQIIPCYVLHIDFGTEFAKELFNSTNSTAPKKTMSSRVDTDFGDTDNSPGAKVAKKEALKAQAMKWLPHGFGTATGTNFVVEDIADISDDDDEEFGEFQAMRGEQESEYHSWQTREADETTSWFDEYQTVRSSNKDVRVGRGR